ncbi:PREDICTED: catalase-like [Papilio xuthus]|uniref:Catalase-like n=1 Tax=Papilio xuthus TaxID=66420 RepID=A0AAJ6ZKN5_PAPXU|nr:PREDICTED: catalase-like [Papilio xuthus]
MTSYHVLSCLTLAPKDNKRKSRSRCGYKRRERPAQAMRLRVPTMRTLACVLCWLSGLSWLSGPVGAHGDDFLSRAYENRTDPASRQLYDFRKTHPKPIGLFALSSGYPVEIRETNALNSDLLMNRFFLDNILHFVSERIPERVAAGKGTAALGYFEVTHDVSQYTKAEVFTGVGKRTPVSVRFSTTVQNRGGVDAGREPKGMAVKFYTKEGNLDLLCLNAPVYFYKDPEYFFSVVHGTRRNPRTDLFDRTMRGDVFTLRFDAINAFLRLLSDSGIPNGYRKMDVFPIHTFEIYNAQGEKYFVKFNFRTLQGIENLPSDEATRLNGQDPDYYVRDLYNAIAEKRYPMWRLDMDVLTFKDLLHLDFDPFDVTRLWKKGTYHTVTVGRLVLDRNPDNSHRVAEQLAFNPANLVPGIAGPKDLLFRGRSLAYPATQNHRLGSNHNKIEINRPLYEKNYNRDGDPPERDNMKDAPSYYPNSFSGPVPYVDAARPKEQIMVYASNAVDLEDPAYFYNQILQTDDERDRLANNTVDFALLTAPPFLQRRVIKLFSWISPDLGRRVALKLRQRLAAPPPPPPRVLRVANCSAAGDERDCDRDHEDISYAEHLFHY